MRVKLRTYSSTSGSSPTLGLPHQTAAGHPGSAREYLAERLPEYMMPVTIVFLDHIPLTRPGRSTVVPCRRRMPSCTNALPCARFRWSASSTDVLAECLQISTLGIDDNFFEVVDTRCWRPRSCRGCATSSRSICRFAVVFEMPKRRAIVSFLLNAPDAKIGNELRRCSSKSPRWRNEVDALLASRSSCP